MITIWHRRKKMHWNTTNIRIQKMSTTYNKNTTLEKHVKRLWMRRKGRTLLGESL